MKPIFIALWLIVFSLNLEAQTKAEKERAKIEDKIEMKLSQYIANIIDGFDLDEFQKHILTQRLNTYYDELKKINLLNIKEHEKTALVNDLDSIHFKDIEEMLGEEFVDKLIEKAKGNDKSDQKKKKKKRKKKRDN
ncbi:hypothetical protein [Psychroserpens sp.]|uniref:hypothetical protein n=1 Tax=Psychroserpens sp. TaxID=2020870 RepID=UPI00385F197C